MGTQLPSPKKGTEPPIGQLPLWPTDWCIEMPLVIEVDLNPGDFVLDGDPAPLPKKGALPPIFGPCLFWPNGWMDQVATWYKVGLGPGDIVLDGDPAPSQKGTAPNFRPMSIVAKRLYVSGYHLLRS